MKKEVAQGIFIMGVGCLVAGVNIFYLDWLDAVFEGDVNKVIGTFFLTVGLVAFGIWMGWKLWRGDEK